LKYFDFSKNSEIEAMYYVYAVLSSATYLDTFEGILYRSSDPSNPPRIPLAQLREDRINISDLGRNIAECEKPDFQAEDSTEYKLQYPKNFTAFKLSKHTFDEKKQTLFLSSETETIKILGVATEVVSLSIAEHNVVDKWIRERTYSYLRRDFGRKDIAQLLNLFSAIKSQKNYTYQVDHRLVEILSNKKFISTDHL
jgi:hypothetical protein